MGSLPSSAGYSHTQNDYTIFIDKNWKYIETDYEMRHKTITVMTAVKMFIPKSSLKVYPEQLELQQLV
jgi:hypothetical protein